MCVGVHYVGLFLLINGIIFQKKECIDKYNKHEKTIDSQNLKIIHIGSDGYLIHLELGKFVLQVVYGFYENKRNRRADDE